jgi:magnesium transporter
LPAAKETAGRHLVRAVPTARADALAARTRESLSGRAYDCTDAVYLLDAEGRLEGLVLLTTLLAAEPQTCLRTIATMPAPAVTAETDQEHVASIAIAHGLASVPVVDAAGRLVGVVPAQILLEVLRHEHVEDLHRLAGIRHEQGRARDAIEAPPLRRARDRMPWLLVGLAGSALATALMTRFERALDTQVAIAFFVPGLVYLADAIGTQTEAIAVRGLSLSRGPLGRLIAGEARTGLLIGLALGAASFAAVWAAFGSARLAAAVGLTLLAAAAVATTIGLVLPWALARAGRDPAYGSGPLATIIQDVLTLAIYFLAVTALL